MQNIQQLFDLPSYRSQHCVDASVRSPAFGDSSCLSFGPPARQTGLKDRDEDEGREESVCSVFTPSPWFSAALRCAVPFFSFYVHQPLTSSHFRGSASVPGQVMSRRLSSFSAKGLHCRADDHTLRC
ncbi:hypothetical protein SETIT_9G452900v2 [Setaria italica]|uniref:Uncharacterized protein n=1 Tax=Setaria italica TaxID=4555 RepID=A0A368SSN1_SETIT|nr:hypothetical protein SETIT_9G452900v2 [Setaria italica]